MNLPRARRTLPVLFATLVLAACGLANAAMVTLRADRADGVYDVGQSIRFTVTCFADDAPVSIPYVLKKGGLTEIGKGSVELRGGMGVIESKLDAPGTLLLELITTGADGKEKKVYGGAVAAPNQIKPSSARPDDFDDFWASRIRKLNEVPPNPQLQPAPSGKEGVEYFKLTLDNINGAKIRGQLARPSVPGKRPALLIPQWAGVYPLDKSWAIDRAAEGWLVLNILAHDLPIDEPKAFYDEQGKGALKDYWSIGNDDRDASYYLRMYLSCYRAADYLTSRDDWDGRTLVVMGASQGGQQALVTAAIHPKVTAAAAHVPAGCDMLGPNVGRKGGFPQWYWKTQGKDEKRVRETSKYFDVVNFAPRIKCPTIVGIGLIDGVCPPEGIIAACNLITAPKEIIVLPRGDHQEENQSHVPYNDRLWKQWLPAQREAKPAPVQDGRLAVLAPTPPMGWNSWNTFQTRIDEKLIKETADAMVASGMRDAGYVYINLDDGWSTKERDASGNLVADPERFPSGMKGLADYVHERGFKLGIYNCAGTKTCAGYPGGKGHEEKDAKLYASWGIDYLKYDWCNTEGVNAREAYPQMRDALRATGRPIVFSMCEWGTSKPWEWADTVAHLWRTTGDITDIYEGKEKWSIGWKTILDSQVGLEKHAGPGHWNDPDMLVVGRPRMTAADNRAHFALWCMLAAPLIAGNDVRDMKPEIRDLLTHPELIAINQDPLGKQGYRLSHQPGREVWLRELSNGEFAVCLFNSSNGRSKLSLNWNELPVLNGKAFTVRDVLRRHDLDESTAKSAGVAIELDAHDVAVWRLRPNR